MEHRSNAKWQNTPRRHTQSRTQKHTPDMHESEKDEHMGVGKGLLLWTPDASPLDLGPGLCL